MSSPRSRGQGRKPGVIKNCGECGVSMTATQLQAHGPNQRGYCPKCREIRAARKKRAAEAGYDLSAALIRTHWRLPQFQQVLENYLEVYNREH